MKMYKKCIFRIGRNNARIINMIHLYVTFYEKRQTLIP